MEIRDVIRIKKGSGGLDPPENLCILLDREKEGKDHYALVHTLKGRMRLKWDHLKDETGAVYSGDKTDHDAMTALLRTEIERMGSKNALRLDPDVIMDTLKVADLRRSVLGLLASRGKGSTDDPPPLSPADIARAHYDPFIPDKRQVKAVERVLQKAENEDRPYFSRSTGDIEEYLACPENRMKGIEGHARRLEELKSAYVDWVQEENDGRTVRSPVSRVDDISNIDLQGDLREEMERVCLWGLAYLENGTWVRSVTPVLHVQDKAASPVGLGGTTVRRLDGFDLERFLAFFFKDLPLSRSDDLPSNILLTLLKLKRISWRTSSELVIHHKIATGARKFHRRFSDTVLEASMRLHDTGEDPRVEGRTDLRSLETYTIDPSDAKDFDDAVSLETSIDGHILYVHIADVTHYVRPGDPVDSEAMFRATSVYLPSGVLPMLPPRLSEDLCSLREGADRLAMTARIELDRSFHIVGSEFFPSIIRVKANLSYEIVEGYIEEEKEPFSTLHRLSETLSGSVRRMDLETPERRVRFVGDDMISTTLKRPTRSTRLIEELMVLTNERAAELLESRGAPCIYRIHPIPDASGLGRFNAACEVLGIPIRLKGEWCPLTSSGSERGSATEDSMLRSLMAGGKLSFGSMIDMDGDTDEEEKGLLDKDRMDAALDEINEALSSIHSLEEEWMRDLLSFTLLRSMSKAMYSLENSGHFGLRSTCYCHFTSPIRRYADVVIHRIMKAILSSEGKGTDVTWEIPDPEDIGPLIDHINDMSRSAEEWERQMVDVALSTGFAMEGDTAPASGRITSIAPGACYISLDEGMVEGRMSYRNMSKIRISPDENLSMIQLSLDDNMGRDLDQKIIEELARGGGFKTLFKLGDRIACRVRSISISEGSIELTLA